jgi:subtilisin family serine protease
MTLKRLVLTVSLATYFHSASAGTVNGYNANIDSSVSELPSYSRYGTSANANIPQKNQVIKSTRNPSKLRKVSGPDSSNNKVSKNTAKFSVDSELENDVPYTYIVELNELPVAQEANSLAELKYQKQLAKQTQNASSLRVNQANRANHLHYALNKQLDKIEVQQRSFLEEADAQLINIKVLTTYKYGINGLAIRATQAQAQTLSQSPHVKRIKKEQTRTLDTDRGPVLIGAPQVWDGTAFSGVSQTLGEGIVVGIIDSGVNTDHPSFAEVAGDGYIHSNPKGDGNYLGDCAGNFATLCNNKLIGVYSYTELTNDYADTSVFPPNLPRNGEDYGGHGSHVASIAAGNILLDVDEVYPTIGEERSAGTPTGFTFDQISGVAPRANIISYQVCYGGTAVREDKYADCLDTPILKAIDDAIRDNVDVINYSISGGGDPWTDPTEQAFLSARNAGIFVAVSAGNSGPDISSSDKTAPWYSSIAASEHGRENVFAKELNNFTGGASDLAPIVGQSNSGSVTAPIVFAGDFNNSNDPGGDPAQCLEPFPLNTFSGQIVVCERGEIARIQKAINVRDGGAGGYVLINVDGGDTFLADDQYVVPGIHTDASAGNRLKAWLATGVNHRATISAGTPKQVVDASRVDVMADYSSRGPNTSISTLMPTMTAPGSNIFAAYADEQLGHDGHEPEASDFTTLDGTSMSSPHVAGSAALIIAANPSWGPDEVRSALALTATSGMKKEDATTNANFFDMGSGRIQVDKAIASPLIMSESAVNYATADPNNSGEPRNLNLPSITDNQCEGLCTWSRTFTATTDATFDLAVSTMSDGLSVEATPSRFTLLEGQSQTLTFTINSLLASKVEYSFALATLSSPGLPDVNIPISILSSIGNFPLSIDFNGQRAADSFIKKNIDAIGIGEFELIAYMPVKSTVVNTSIAQDTNPGDYLDDISDGVSITTITVPEDAKRLIAEIKQSSARDLDLFLLFDANNDGRPSVTEEIATSRSGGSFEEVQINYPQSGTYFIAVQNYEGSAGGTDTVEMRYAVVSNELAGDSLSPEVINNVENETSFDLRIIYNLPESQSGDDYFAAFGMGTSPGSEDIGLLSIDINRVDNDVFVDGVATRLNAGDSASFDVVVADNPSNEERNYRVVLPLPVGTMFTNFSRTNSGQMINNELVWFVDKPVDSLSNTRLSVTIEALNGAVPGPIIISAKSELTSLAIGNLESTDDFTSIQVEGSPVVTINGNNTDNLTVTETQTLRLPITITEPNSDATSLAFTQTAGPTVNISEVAGEYFLTAPLVSTDTELAYDILVSDTNANTGSANIRVNVLNNGTPVINSISAPTTSDGGQSITISVSANDPENETLTILIDGRAISGTSTTLVTPTTGTSVSYEVAVSDGITQAEQSVTISLTQTSSQGSSGGGTMSYVILSLIPIMICRRLNKKRRLHQGA